MKKKQKNEYDDIYKTIINDYFEFISDLSEYYSRKRLERIMEAILGSTKNLTQFNKKINIFIENKNYNKFISSYTNILKDIDFKDVSINSDGTIQYEDEKIKIQEDNINESLDIIKDIQNNTNEIKKKVTSKKSIIIIVILFIIQGIASGFLNKCGENIYELIPSAYNTFLEANNLKNKKSSKEIFINRFRIVNANELNVREEPDSKSTLIGKLYLNECVEVTEKTSHWTKVQYVNKEKGIIISGWVYSRYLLHFDEESSELLPD